MQYPDLASYLDRLKEAPPKAPVCLIMAEDEVEIASTLSHHLAAGFGTVILLTPPEIGLPEGFEDRVHHAPHDVFAEAALPRAVNRLNAALPAGTWVYYCYNAEYLFIPFGESRNVREMLAFHTEERRSAMLTYVIDLYAADLGRFGNAVSLEDAHMDRSGYYAQARKDADRNWEPKERQLDFHGGLRWRFEEHIPFNRRKIDRISIFRTAPDLRLRPDFTFSEEEYNTYACPWHHNLTATVCSFRTAKALRTNPGSRFDIATFHWHNSVRFGWNSQQLMDLGLMEPGQWF